MIPVALTSPSKHSSNSAKFQIVAFRVVDSRVITSLDSPLYFSLLHN